MAPAPVVVTFIVTHFCTPDADVHAKRRQCVFIGFLFLSLFILTINLVVKLATDFFEHTGIVSVVCITLYSLVVVYSRYTRRSSGIRIVLTGMLYHMLHLMYIRGGIVRVPLVALSGLMAPTLSLFIGTHALEPLGWFLAWIGGIAVILALEVNNKLVTIPIDTHLLAFKNAMTIISLAAIYMTLFWFVISVYTTEFENRKTLEETVHVFTRLSHEIRTPVTVIAGLAELMKDWRTLSSEQQCMITDLDAAARRIGSVVHELLSASGQQHQHAPSTPVTEATMAAANVPPPLPNPAPFPPEEPVSAVTLNTDVSGGGAPAAESAEENPDVDFNIREVVDVAVAYHLPLVEASNIHLYLDIPPELPTLVNGARSRLISILDHLFNNAVKFTPTGVVELSVSIEAISENGVVVRFEIRDTGVGLTAEQLANIVTQSTSARPFYSYLGVDMDVSLPMRMVQLWPGHSLRAASDGPGQGAAFWFTAPFALPTPTGEEAVVPAPFLSMNVLLVDDDDQSAYAIIQTCQTIGLSKVGRARSDNVSAHIPTNCPGAIVLLTVPHFPAVAVEQTKGLAAAITQSCPGVRMVVLGPSFLGDWCQSILHCAHLSNPPPANQLRTLLEAPPSSTVLQPVAAPAAAPVDPSRQISSRSLSLVVDDVQAHLISPSSTVEPRSDLVTASSTGLPPITPTSAGTDPSPPTPAPPRERHGRVLCVDDNAVVLRLLSSFLYKVGFCGTVDTAVNGAQALRLIQQNPNYSLIFMDFNMQNMNGAEVTTVIRQTHSMAQLPVIGLTAATNMHDICIKAGMNEVIFKPFTTNQIREILDRYIA